MGNLFSRLGRRQVDADLELFLIGKTGKGKSATGNTILGRKRFKDSDMGQSATLKTAAGWTNIDGQIVKVVDGPGLVDTRLVGVNQLIQTERSFIEGFLHCPNGFHALVLVLSYGTRFTEEEKNTVKLLKGMLGEDFIRNYCILAFTHGENFLMKNSNGDFKEWCRKQTGDLRQLMDECCNRVVLFHNLKPEKRDESIRQLIDYASEFNERYTMELFDRISLKRSEFILEEGAIQLKGLIQSKIDMIIECLEREETGDRLNILLHELEAEIKKEKKEQQVVEHVKRGIQCARKKKYNEALELFQNITYDAELLELRFFNAIFPVLHGFLQPFADLLA